jgi:hypothetical protein
MAKLLLLLLEPDGVSRPGHLQLLVFTQGAMTNFMESFPVTSREDAYWPLAMRRRPEVARGHGDQEAPAEFAQTGRAARRCNPPARQSPSWAAPHRLKGRADAVRQRRVEGAATRAGGRPGPAPTAELAARRKALPPGAPYLRPLPRPAAAPGTDLTARGSIPP